METAMGRGGKKAGPGGLFFVGIIFLVTGFFTSNIITGIVLEDVKAAQNWPRTTRTVEGSAVYESGKNDSGSPMYSFDVLVSYEVDGVMYSTGQLNPMGGSSSTTSRRSVQEKADAYPEGARVSVYYNPEDPGQGVLELKLPLLLRLLFKLPFLGILLGILLIIRGILRLVKLGLGLGFLLHSSKKERGLLRESAGQRNAKQGRMEQGETVPDPPGQYQQKGDDVPGNDGFSI